MDLRYEQADEYIVFHKGHAEFPRQAACEGFNGSTRKATPSLLFCWGMYSKRTNFSLRMQRQNDFNVIPTVLYIATPHKSKLLRRGWVYLFILSIIFCESMRKKYLSIGSLHYIMRFSLERFQ